jgi:hypothetical protein
VPSSFREQKEMIDYIFDPFQFLGYLALIIFVSLFFRKRFDKLSLLLLTVTTVFAFEVSWEIPANLYELWINHIFVASLVAKHFFMLAPMFLWSYYAWIYGKRRYLFLFGFAVCFELIFLLSDYAAHILTVLCMPWLIRIVWVSVFLVNMYSWNDKSMKSFKSNKI